MARIEDLHFIYVTLTELDPLSKVYVILTELDPLSKVLLFIVIGTFTVGLLVLNKLCKYVDKKMHAILTAIDEFGAMMTHEAEETRTQNAGLATQRQLPDVMTTQAFKSSLTAMQSAIEQDNQTQANSMVERVMSSLPAFVGKMLNSETNKNLVHGNLVQGVQHALQGPHDEHTMLYQLRKLYLALQPTKLLSQQGQTTQSSLDELQGSLQQWMQGEIIVKLDAIIDILSKIQVELTTLSDSAGPDFTQKVVSLLEQLHERHEQAKDQRMELGGQQHALMNHVKQACSMGSNTLSQLQGVSNTQWTHGDMIHSLEEAVRENAEKLKRQSEVNAKLQTQMEKILTKLSPSMPAKAPPSAPPSSSTTPATTGPDANAPSTAGTTPQNQPPPPAPPVSVPQTLGPGAESPVIRISEQMGQRQPLQLFESLTIPQAQRWPVSFPTGDPRAQQALAYLLGL
ncbi:unnamed protein product, partial [Symbiodinium sp. CCMP2456]